VREPARAEAYAHLVAHLAKHPLARLPAAEAVLLANRLAVQALGLPEAPALPPGHILRMGLPLSTPGLRVGPQPPRQGEGGAQGQGPQGHGLGGGQGGGRGGGRQGLGNAARAAQGAMAGGDATRAS
jgi:hypothetical protein